jgi:hypothetical protein
MAEPDVVSIKTENALSLNGHRRAIGLLGCALPLLVWLGAGIRPTKGLTDWQLLGAVSEYYYTGAVALFVGILFALSLFLITYRGYKEDRADRIVGGIGGWAGIFVTLFPTQVPKTNPENAALRPDWWRDAYSNLHFAAATVLFFTLMLFCLWLFRLSNIKRPQERPAEKRVRNAFFLAAGVMIGVCMLWAWLWGRHDKSIFWPETLAIEAFALSWLIKSESLDAPLICPVAKVAKRWLEPAASAPR